MGHPFVVAGLGKARTDNGEIQGLFPFGFAQGQNDDKDNLQPQWQKTTADPLRG
jgi:hypothetical protein